MPAQHEVKPKISLSHKQTFYFIHFLRMIILSSSVPLHVTVEVKTQVFFQVARVLMSEEALMVSSSSYASGRHRSTLTSTGSPEQVREHGQTEDDIHFDTGTMAFVETPLSVNGLLLALFTLFAVILTFVRQIRI